MKKAIVLLLALAVLGGAVFAQDAAIAFSGYIDTGIAVFTEGSADPTLGLWGDDSGKTSRFNLQAAYTNGNYGATARLRAQGDFTEDYPVFFVNRAYVWGEMFDGMVKTVAGRLGDYTWSTAANDIGNFDTMTGFMLQIKPIEGLNFGVMLPATSDATARPLLKDALADLNFGAAYDVDGIGGFRAGVDLSPVADSTMAYFGAEITAVENFVFYLDYQATDLGNDVTGSHYLFQEVDYTMDALNVGIDLEQQFWAYTDAPIYLSFGPYASYSMDKFVLGAAFTYMMETEDAAGDTFSGIYINPYAKYLLAAKATIELGAKINTGDIDGAASPLAADKGRYYLTYTWSF
ncbi:MAG: hypothetical protein CVV47_10785 [Spirochaetae bacterium HGW-Spirochaetae-3]|jgi:hypothetical protein|nr:MAG: hypothetical protein CVV47_10785 [Spirochaetae bacterium HGW-Spirochaetae-3]